MLILVVPVVYFNDLDAHHQEKVDKEGERYKGFIEFVVFFDAILQVVKHQCSIDNPEHALQDYKILLPNRDLDK